GYFGFDPVIDRLAEFTDQPAVQFTGVLSGPGCDLGRKKSGNDPVLICRPDAAVLSEKRGAGAFFTDKSQRPVDQSVDKPLKADRHFVQPPFQTGRHAIDDAAAYEGFTHCSLRTPTGAVAEQVVDANREIVIRRQQSRTGGNDAMPVVIGVAGDGDIEFV